MTLYAAERIDDAVSLTRSLLVPFRWGLWARLAVVGAFVAAGSGGGGTLTGLGDRRPALTDSPETPSRG